MTLFKGLSGGKPLQDWLYDMNKLEKDLSGGDVYYGTALACLEFAKNGITTVCDNYHFADYSARAFADCGIRAVVGITQRYNLKKFLSEDETMELYTKVSNISDLITANFYCHSIYNANENMFGVINKLAQKTNSQVSTHASETLEEVGKCAKDNDDMSPISLLESYGFFDRNSLVFHATNVDTNDINILSKYKANVCANFGSNYKLASGVAPIYQMSKSGINVCLGTDGSASNNRLDMFREMYLAVTSQNILLSKSNCFLPKDILKMATVNGAKALGLNNVGTLEIGSLADLIMLDSHNVDALPDYDIFDNLVYSYGTEDVLMTMVNGKIVYQNGKYNFAKTKNAILSKAKEIKEKFLNK
ncbi:MAG: amidohydrolase family protein, partial [Clostridia bacterium]|nr:amidohydrolase family protein [Clostridia bacterium]